MRKSVNEEDRAARVEAILREAAAMRQLRPMSPWRNATFGDLVVTVGSLPDIHRIKTPHGTINVAVDGRLPSGEIQIRQGEEVLVRIVGVGGGSLAADAR